MSLSDFHWSDMITKVVSAVVILVITFVIAKVLKKVLSRQLSRVKVLQQDTDNGDTLASSLATIASLIVWLFGLMAVLNIFALTQVVAPIQGLLNGILGALPNILGAGILLFIGYVLAKIARDLVTTALRATNVDHALERLEQRTSAGADAPAKKPAPSAGATPAAHGAGTTPAAHGASLGAQYDDGRSDEPVRISTMAGQAVFAIVLLVVAISALQVLDIKAISDPASHMLELILNSLPLILGAGILLAIGVVIARFVGKLTETMLRGVNLDATAQRLGVDTGNVALPTVLARVVQVAIVLFFAIAATKMLNFPQITDILNAILALAGHVAFGAVVIIAGVFLAKLIASFASGQTATVIRYATIVLFAAIGLRYMGLANSIINLAFGAVVVGGAAAAAIAFGLGGRDAAARQLETIQAKRKSAETSSPSNGQ